MLKKIILALLMSFSAVMMLAGPASAEDFPVTSPFGWRIHPIYGTWKFHAGVDLGYPEGSPVISLFDGQVVQAGDYDDGYGNQVLIYHAQIDAYTRYAHMSALETDAGAYVSAGDVIGYVGATGNVTGPHLHLEYIVRGASGEYEYADPLSLWGY
ncbi:M23 family metallopeptidase [uncultured Mitsuokella sp.]|uniref:M23 family metallopeptidase n=1 Tax=uncultured Mitsuokella sp. TaxID=453120 RepID=UPI0026DCCFBF|nr:M23 family metallopeptidase [uncultured Mitsuokella sp.]